MSGRQIVGFDRRVDLDWLDAVAGQVAAGASSREIRDFTYKLLDGKLSGNANNSARGKTVTVLRHIWSSVPESCEPLRDRAAHLFGDTAPDHRIAIHWAMMTATYSFFHAVTEHLGRLLSLQGSFTLLQLTRRISEDWGERSTLSRAVQRIVRSMVQWGVIVDAGENGLYHQAKQIIPVSRELAELLLESILVERDGCIPIEQASRLPSFFPFKVSLSANQLRQSPPFAVHRQGLDNDVVELRGRA